MSSSQLLESPTILIGFFPKLQLIKNQFRTISKWDKLPGSSYYTSFIFNARCASGGGALGVWVGGEKQIKDSVGTVFGYLND